MARNKKSQAISTEKTISGWEFYKANKKEVHNPLFVFSIPLLLSSISIAYKDKVGDKIPFVKTISSQDYFLSIFVIASLVIMFIGTLGFLKETQKLLGDYNKSNEKIKNRFKRGINWTIITLIITFVALIMCCIIISFFQEYISKMLFGFEIASTVVFLIFILIDIWIMNGAKLAKNELSETTEGEQGKKFRRSYFFSRDSILFIDLPVFLASVVILCLSIHFINEDISNDHNNIFHNGFSTGALVVHIIFSQYIFMMLKIRDSFTAINEVVG